MPVLPFSKLNKLFFWVLDPEKIFDTLIQTRFLQIMKINNFRGDFTDNSAKKNHWSMLFWTHMPLPTRAVSAGIPVINFLYAKA